MMWKAFILGATLAAVGVGPVIAETARRQFGNLVYTPPEGWSSGREDNGIFTMVSDLPDDYCASCYIHLSAGLTDETDPARAIDRRGLRFLDEEDRAGVTLLEKAEPFMIGARPGAMQAFKDGDDVLFVLAIGLSDRVEMVALHGGGGGGDKETFAQTVDVLQTTVTPLIEGLAFAFEGAPSLLPAPAPGDLDGVWWGWNTSNSVGMDMTVRMDMEFRTLVFWPDGRLVDGMPPAGLSAAPDLDAAMAEGRTDFGVYARDADTLTLTFATGETEALKGDGGGWSDGERTMNPAAPLPDGASLTGRISSSFYTGYTPGTGLEGGISAASETVFSPDGTYAGSSFGGASANYDGGGFTVGDTDATGGTYLVRDGLLISAPNDGSPPRTVMALAVDDMVILGNQFLRTD